MSDSTVKGKFDEIAGKVKQGLGEAVGNENLANKGAAQEVKGHAEQAWGSVKDAAADIHDENKATVEEHKDHASHLAHDIREKITSTAQNVKEAITGKSNEVRDTHTTH